MDKTSQDEIFYVGMESTFYKYIKIAYVVLS